MALVESTDPTLARLSFWVSPMWMREFEISYAEQVVPVLEEHGLVESDEHEQVSAAGIFSRLFKVGTPAEILVRENALRKDPAWHEVLWSLGIAFGTPEPDDLIRFSFGLYKTPAGPGKMVETGPGIRRGLWQIFGLQDGLQSSIIFDILQDQSGDLWFATEMGVTRYDGAQFVTFTREDGLANDSVIAITEDRAGHLWFCSGWGGGIQAGALPATMGRSFPVSPLKTVWRIIPYNVSWRTGRVTCGLVQRAA